MPPQLAETGWERNTELFTPGSMTYTPQLADEICERISLGQSLVSICKDQHIPGMATIFRWLERDLDGFVERYTRAREVQAETLLDELVGIADGASETDVRSTQLRVDTRKWAIAKLAPRKYGERLSVDVEVRISVNQALEAARARVIEGKAKHIEAQPDDDI